MTTMRAAAILGVSDRYVRRLVRKKILRGRKLGPNYWVFDKSVWDLKRERDQTGRPKLPKPRTARRRPTDLNPNP